MDSTTKTAEVAVPEARMGERPGLWEVHGNVWSAALGAVIGAGIVLLIAALILMWRKPRRRELPLLAPMDVGYNVSVLSLILYIVYYIFLRPFCIGVFNVFFNFISEHLRRMCTIL